MSDQYELDFALPPAPLRVSGNINGGLKGHLSGTVTLGPMPWWRRWRDWFRDKSLLLARVGLLEFLHELISPGPAYRSRAVMDTDGT